MKFYKIQKHMFLIFLVKLIPTRYVIYKIFSM